VNAGQHTTESRACKSTDGRDAPASIAMSRPLALGLAIASMALAFAGLIAELKYANGELSSEVTHFLSLSAEGNLPTWYATCLLFWCSLLLVENGQKARAMGEPRARTWLLLAALFLYMSLDEAVEIHEYLGDLFDGQGILYFSWVIPASGFVVVVGALCARFVFGLPRQTRHRFIAAGALYVGGALGMELPLGLWVEQQGDDNLTYAVLDLIEETLELVGASLFVAALDAYRRAPWRAGAPA
jgi:hypothetical protein